MLKPLKEKSRRRWRAMLAISLICILLMVVLVFIPWCIEDRVWPGKPGSPGSQASQQWLFWLGVASGNWSAASPPKISRWAFACSAVLAVLVNNALLFTVVGFVWRAVVVWRRVRMQVGQAFVSRDQMNKQALFRRLDVTDPNIRQQINEAFKEGEQKWRENLYRVFGERKANYIIELLSKEI